MVVHALSFGDGNMLATAAFIWPKSNSKNCKIVKCYNWNELFYLNVLNEFSASVLQSSVSHDPSEIFLICWFGAQKTFFFYNQWWKVVLVNIFWKHLNGTVDLLAVQDLYSIHKFRVFGWCLSLNRSLSQTFTAVKGWRCRNEVAAEALATRNLRTSIRPRSSNTSTKGKEMADSSHAENKINLPCDAYME